MCKIQNSIKGKLFFFIEKYHHTYNVIFKVKSDHYHFIIRFIL